MELQPFGPVEQAIQKSTALQPPKPKPTGPFLLGVGVTLAAGAAVWLIYGYIVRKKKDNVKNDVPAISESNS